MKMLQRIAAIDPYAIDHMAHKIKEGDLSGEIQVASDDKIVNGVWALTDTGLEIDLGNENV